MKKRGISPVIATVLLIAMVVVLAGVVFAWFQSISEEAITKFDGTNVKIVCENVKFDMEYNNGNLIIKNTGTVPIYQMRIKTEGDGVHDSIILNEDHNWPESGIMTGGIYSGNVDIGGANKISFFPILLGTTKEGEKTHVCEDRFKQDLVIGL